MNKLPTTYWPAIFAALCLWCQSCEVQNPEQPNVILLMADDLGYGDLGCFGHPYIQTPNLDGLAGGGIVFERFYAAAPVCSPTRGSVMTGRHPFRYGIYYANVGHLPEEEVTIAEILRNEGYRTGHFGKWHLGTLTRNIVDSRRGGRPEESMHYAPPWEHGFDVCFSGEAAVPTWDPMVRRRNTTDSLGEERIIEERFSTRYWTGEDEFATSNLEGDDSRVIMDRVIPFIQEAVQAKKPFLAVVWFHTPHAPVIGGPAYLEQYAEYDMNHRHYYGCITAMDEQIGRLVNALKETGSLSNTMIWFNSDNGPAARGGRGGIGFEKGGRDLGETGGLRERKGTLYEGGIRVPGILYWLERTGSARRTSFPAVTSDLMPTILDYLDIPLPDGIKLDGISLKPMIESDTLSIRSRPIGFRSLYRGYRSAVWHDNRYKLYHHEDDDSYELYDMYEDPFEKTEISEEQPGITAELKQAMNDWRAAVEADLECNEQ